MSEHHETKEDRAAEFDIVSEFIDAVSLSGSAEFTKLPEGYGYSVDYRLSVPPHKAACAVVEVKDRPGWGYHEDGSRMTTVILGANKVNVLIKYSDIGVCAFFVVRLPELGVCWIKVDRAKFDKYRTKRGGRYDRGEKEDVEKLYHIPIKDFNVLGNS